jgi:hypothetical protein
MQAIIPFFKRLFIFCSPFLIVLIIYLLSDPYKILYNYDNYNEGVFIPKNRDFISTEMYLKNSTKYRYDSFILGSSSALSTPPTIWKKYITTSNNIFSFDASGENIVGIWSKIKYIHKTKLQIKNAILILDTNFTFISFANDNPIFMKHYKVYASSKFNFHYKYYLNFLNLKFLVGIVHYKISSHFYPYMADILVNRPFYYDTITNEMKAVGRTNELRSDSINYYKKQKELLHPRSLTPYEISPQINKGIILMLSEIKEIFENDSTDFRIIISPLFNQIKFNKKDLDILKKIFGENMVYDFSGINMFTDKISNYYDNLHFKQYVGNQILDSVYCSSTGIMSRK